jgi:hypothetical protein
MIEETQILLDLWQEGMSAPELAQLALVNGQFPNVAARRLRNVVAECFAPRYLRNGAEPARLLKRLRPVLKRSEFEQLLFLYTCRANLVLYDFVQQVYWQLYTSGRNILSNEDAREFIKRANQEGKTTAPWSESTVIRVARYLTGTCADFGLLERTSKSVRRILPYHLEPRVALVLAHELHVAGLGDNLVLAHPDWDLFGLERLDVLEELRRLALQDWLIVQAAGNVIRIEWQHKDMEALANAIAARQLR